MTSKKDTWRKLAEAELRGRPLDDLTWQTLEGIPVSPLYTEEDVEGLPHMGSIPGQAPFTRGVKATMYAGRPWTIRQYAGFSTAEESNALPPVSRVFRSHSTWPPIAAMTAITRASRGTWARRAWRLIPSRT
jgi:methylmalonyl-CoA mutase N-terminal domain/subunit